MAVRLTENDARRSMRAHATARGAALRKEYGIPEGLSDIRRILKDDRFVRYPCELLFDANRLNAGEMAHPEPRSDRPDDGFTMLVHPALRNRPEWIPHVVLYQLVVVNYGDFASHVVAEAFGASCLDLSEADYYSDLCTLADSVAAIDRGDSENMCATLSASL